MGMVIDCPEAGLDMLLYGSKNNILSNYLNTQLQQLPQQFNEFSGRIYDSIASSYNYINDKLIQYGIMNQLERQNITVIDNQIDELLTYQQINNASITMQRYIMAHQGIRQLYLDQNVDGYSNTYNNLFGKTIQDNHYDYRRVMDEVVIDNVTDFEWVMKFYHDNLEAGDRDINHHEKVKILNTWKAMDWFLDTCKFDFTNVTDEPTKINS
ncbi:MAG: hypothetical protein ACD_33C00045G0034 [uncultured bacterium]|nr:MAG: hypothetical protein ACD_33C00045G0034 [uncultured bacterium]